MPIHLVTKDIIIVDGAAKGAFDPDNGYRDAYKRLGEIIIDHCLTDSLF
jgi:hypothetical protein